MLRPTRRDFLRMGAAGLAAATLARGEDRLRDQVPGERPTQDKSVRVLNPQTRVPVSLRGLYRVRRDAVQVPDIAGQGVREADSGAA